MPAWVKEIIQQQSPKAEENLEDLRSELQKLLDEFKIPTPAFRELSLKKCDRFEEAKDGEIVSRPDKVEVSEFSDEIDIGVNERLEETISGQRADQQKIRRAPKGAKSSKALKALEQVPKIHILTEPALIDEKSIKGKVASYYKDSQEIFVNGLYLAVDRMSSELEVAMASIGEGEERREAILTTARRSMAFRVGKAFFYAISKRLVEEWNANDLERATSPEALSLMADDYRQGLVEAKRHATQLIKIKEASNLNTAPECVPGAA